MWTKKKLIAAILFAVAAVCLLLFFYQNVSEDQDISEEGEQEINTVYRDGHQLAINYCSGCHTFPEPDLLDKHTWRMQTLPAMGPHLGIYEYQGEEYPLDETPNLPENFYPERALIDTSDWAKIIEYYENLAPERLDFDFDVPDIIVNNLFFQTRRPSNPGDTNPMVSTIKFDPGNGLIYLSDATVQRILVYNRGLDIVSSFPTSSPVSDIQFLNDAGEKGKREFVVTFIGDIAPSDRRDGSVVKGWYDPESGEGDFSELIIDEISRPVESLIVDLDLDGTDDLLISEFGHRTGSVFWLKGAEKGYDSEKNVLINSPGCLQSHVMDFTNNGLPDVLALCSQLDQAIYLFENQGEGNFSKKTLLEFPITAGSSSFELADFNEDGHTDILYTSGDNADYSLTYKPYHGVYIYENNGSDNFLQEWFYPANGAYNAKAKDFTGDGNLDIALISFFADYSTKPQEGFIFFQNYGNMDFIPYHPQEASYGRWITMDVADWTGNSVDDIILGNFSRGPTRVHPQIERILTQSPHFLILENHSVQ